MDRSDTMKKYYSIIKRLWKWMKKLFFHLPEITILTSFITLNSCGSKLSHLLFILTMVRDSASNSYHKARKTSPIHQTCHACSTKNKATRMKFQCSECNIGLCASSGIEVYCTKLHLRGPAYTKLGKWSTET